MLCRRLLPWLALAVSGFATAAFGQALVCPASASVGAHACETFHFHIAMYRPETRGFAELFGINQFASQSACDRAREAAIKRNLAVVEKMRVKDTQYEPDRFGTCHCDMTVDRSSPNFLNDLQRVAQFRLAEEIRGRVRERLLDNNVPSDSDAVRGLLFPPIVQPLLAGPKMAPLPAAAPVSTVANNAADLRPTKTVDSSQPSTAAIDMPLVEVPTAQPPAPTAVVAAPTPPTAAPTTAPTPTPTPTPGPAPASVSTTDPAPTTQPTTPAPATPAPLPETKVAEPPPTQPAPATEPAEEAPQPADETAEHFVAYETERIQNVLTASGSIGDEAIKSKIFEACMQRIQLLSNLRSLIQGSGTRSKLATMARNAKNEEERMAFVAALFGPDMPKHWAPQDAKDVVLDPRPELDNDSEKVLRDTGTTFTTEQKKHALYVLLAHTQPTEEQQLWLSTVIDGFLK